MEKTVIINFVENKEIAYGGFYIFMLRARPKQQCFMWFMAQKLAVFIQINWQYLMLCSS